MRPGAIPAIAEWFQAQHPKPVRGFSRYAIWRIAVGQQDWRKAPPAILRSLLHAGWSPEEGRHAVLESLNIQAP